MRCALVLAVAMLFLSVTGFAQNAASDPQTTQTLLVEVHQLRRDLQIIVSSIERLQIMMYRLQAQSTTFDRAHERLEGARTECKQAEIMSKNAANGVEQAEAAKRNAANPAEQQGAEQLLSNQRNFFQSSTEWLQRCQVDQLDAENEVRTEQAKMNELQDQLDKLDKTLAALGQ